ncbi:hypothetical protein [Pseudoalteromonas sp. S558]|uniref:hypothetical protein n=1 Tax=Pseudoalteromonas sp. S558 TaxID=2066515 RepID=UPI00110B2724|nr:hypothetical protein [Pseudoalteromonas sp. S558]TMN99309.1 hypothetical protein CWB66_15950 [Pseudoalteromonas sp. S558]
MVETSINIKRANLQARQWPSMNVLSNKTKKIIGLLFKSDQAKIVEKILSDDCPRSISSCNDWEAEFLERIWISVLKISSGDMKKFESAVKLANTDYRDLFMAAGLGYDSEAHKKWKI